MPLASWIVNTPLALVNRKAFDFDRADERQSILPAPSTRISPDSSAWPNTVTAIRSPGALIDATVSRSLRRYGERKYERTKQNGCSYKSM